MDRREFLRLAGGAVAVTAGSACSGASRSTRPTAGRAKSRLRILQLSHFVPAYDPWFDGFATRWGEEHGVEVVVDRAFADDLYTRAVAEISVGRGHDLVSLAASPVGALEDEVIDQRDLVAEIEAKVGPMLPVLERGVRNPKTGKYVGVPDFWAPIPVNYRTDLWADVATSSPESWEAILRAAPALKTAGSPIGVGLSPQIDSQHNAFSILFAFGASLQDEAGAVTIASPAAVEAVKFAASLYRSGMSEDVLSWDNVADNRFLASGKGSLILDSVSALRATEKQDADLAARIALAPVPSGPAGRFGHTGPLSTYIIWKFAENPSDAARFVADLISNYREAFLHSEFYNLPAFPGVVPDLAGLLAADPLARPRDKYRVLAEAKAWSVNFGHPGSDNPAVAEVVNAFIVGRMFATAARAELTAEEAVQQAAAGAQPIFDKWRERGKI